FYSYVHNRDLHSFPTRRSSDLPRRKRMFSTATQQKVEREVGYAILSAEGYETNDEVVFAEPGDMTLLGVRTLEGFGVVVDNIAHRFVATATLVATVRALNSRIASFHFRTSS